MLGNLGRKVIADLANPLARDKLSGLVSNLASNAVNKIERKISGKRAVRAGKRFTLFILIKNMNDITKTIKLFEGSNVFKTNKKQEDLPALLASLAASLVQSVISSVVKSIKGRGGRRAGRECVNKIFYFFSIL